MTTKTANVILLVLIAICLAVGIVLYPQLPDRIASHWNAAGEVDGYMGKFWGIFLIPAFGNEIAIFAIIIPIAAASIITVVYSYIAYKKIEKK
ncbi:DUF1648 domain-containing protein [Patescibacteria group bacterium]|nr:MAG: DUF1648 domain-containing protein [Patescibacteria group bacterium]